MPGILFALPVLAANPTWAVVQPPPQALDAASDRAAIYFYACTDSACASQSQLETNGYVTAVPAFKGSLTGTWVILETEGVDKYYALWQFTAKKWTMCILHLEPSGAIGTANTCAGAVKIPESSSPDVSKINLNADVFPDAARSPPMPRAYNSVDPRSFTFSNDSSAVGICLQTDSSFAHSLCSGVYVFGIFADPYVHEIPQNGDNSKAAQIIGVKYKATTTWAKTGRDNSGQVYATKMEWNAYPTEVASSGSSIPAESTDHSIGPTFLDVSLVDGFNVGMELTPDQDTVCAVSEKEGGASVFKLFKRGEAMADFPNDVSVPFNEVCPSGFEVQRGPNQRIAGCYSQCSWAHATGQPVTTISQNCCSDRYGTFATCEPLIDKKYIDTIEDTSSGVYTWAYNDYRGTFTCDGSASFSFRFTDVFDRK